MGNLVSQILKDQGTVSSGGFAASKFTEKDHVSSDVILTKLIASYLFKSGGTSATHERCQFGVVAKPEALDSGVVVGGDFDREDHMIGKTHHMCHSTIDTVNGWGHMDEFHFEVSLKVRIPADWNIWGAVKNESGITNAFAYLMRLFWTAI